MNNSFSVFPMTQKISLKAGETYHGYINVAIPAAATEDFAFKVELHPYSVSGKDYDVDLDTKSERSKIVDWIKIEDTEGILAPNGRQKINFTITVPENAPAGGQYAMIGVSSDNSAKEGDVVQNVYEMTSIIFAEIDGEIHHGGEILENYIPGFVTSGAPVVKTTVTNTGNVHETAYSAIKVKNAITGQEIITPRQDDMHESIIMPESTRELVRTLADLPALGVFEVTQDISYLDHTLNNTTVMVVCPIWFIMLVLATILSVVLMIIYGKHLKRKKREKVMQE